MDLLGKVAVVTGGDSGIGRAICELFAEEGARVVIADLSEGNDTASSISRRGGTAISVRTDVRSPDDVGHLVETTIAKFGGIDILVNNAGIELLKPMVETSEVEWDKVLDTNLKGVFLVSKYAVPEIIKRDGGAIVNIASQLGLVGLENFSAYCASKGGVVLLTKAMALELAQHKIRVNCICPGPIQTSMLERELLTESDPQSARKMWASRQPVGRLGRPEEVAHAALFLASSRRSSFITGHALVVDGGYTLR